MPKNKLSVPPPNWNSSCQYTTRKSNRSPRSQTTKLAKPREDTRGKLDAETKQNFFRKPSRSSIPEPANEAKSGDGTRKPMETEPESERLAKRTYGRQLIPEPAKQAIPRNGTRKSMETEPESELLAARTNGRQPKPLGRVDGKTKCELRVPSPNRNFNKGRMGKTNEPGRHVVDIRNSEQNTKGNTEKMVNKTIKNETTKEDYGPNRSKNESNRCKMGKNGEQQNDQLGILLLNKQ